MNYTNSQMNLLPRQKQPASLLNNTLVILIRCEMSANSSSWRSLGLQKKCIEKLLL